ncbi:hypothetical protein [Actinobacillus vicugnae]|uniref:hypothetical protein n=1 Tax=Actinobacillus vicugnae TaxID=2573093 RepID=UPI0012419CAF|nr:hypothetical protein [Actinobacillus vicugnae]
MIIVSLMIIFFIILGFVILKNTTMIYITLFFIALLVGFYICNYRDVNSLAWMIVEGNAYEKLIDEKFKFKTKNLLNVTLSKNINYQLRVYLKPYLKTEVDVLIQEENLKALKEVIVSVYNDEEFFTSFRLYKHETGSWTDGTIIYEDGSRHSVVTGFLSEKFTVPFLLTEKNIRFIFELDNHELIDFF